MSPARALDPTALVLDRAQYVSEVRPDLRARMIAWRAARRVRVGDCLALEFEDAQTLQYQVQEMVMVEGVSDPAGVNEELEAYSRLLPTSHSLCATLFIESEDVATVKEDLQALTGIQHAVVLSVTLADGSVRSIPGIEVPGPDEDGPSEVTHAVHFLRFTLDEQSRDAFRDPSQAAEIVVDHLAYSAATPIEGDLRVRLLADLALD